MTLPACPAPAGTRCEFPQNRHRHHQHRRNQSLRNESPQSEASYPDALFLLLRNRPSSVSQYARIAVMAVSELKKRPFLPYLFPREGKDRAVGDTSEAALPKRIIASDASYSLKPLPPFPNANQVCVWGIWRHWIEWASAPTDALFQKGRSHRVPGARPDTAPECPRPRRPSPGTGAFCNIHRCAARAAGA